MHGKLDYVCLVIIHFQYSDLYADCMDGSDETEAICSEVCRSPYLWLSENGCLDLASTDYLGKYHIMTETHTNGELYNSRDLYYNNIYLKGIHVFSTYP